MKDSTMKISRRQAISKATALMGGTITPSLIFGVWSGCKAEEVLDWTPRALSTGEINLTIALAEQILPVTSTPGAREARVERFIDSMVAGYLTDSERSIFINGLALLDDRDFINQTASEQYEIMTELAEEARMLQQGSDTKPFFLLAKEMTLLGFFTSKIGATQVLNYDPIPGSYHGCLPLQDVGGKTWAT